MTESAVSRTPVEIWHEIFKLAIQTRYRVYDTPSIIEDFRLFDTNCEAIRVLQESRNIQINLKLVCRGWNSIIKDDLGQFISDLKNNFLPSTSAAQTAYRVTIDKVLVCICGCKPCEPKRKWHRYSGSTREEEPTIPACPNLEVLLVQYSLGLATKLIKNARGSLRVLQVSSELDPSHFDTISHLNILSHLDTLSRLTHLYIADCLGRLVTQIEPNVVLPTLRMLWIDISEGNQTSGALWTWKFPQLERLRIFGFCLDSTVPPFIKFHAPTITDLVLQLDLVTATGWTNGWKVIGDDWSIFPRLSLLGGGLDDFYQDAPLQKSTMVNQPNAFDLLLLDFPFGIFNTYYKPITARLPRWRVKRFVIQLEWKEVQRRIEVCHPPRRSDVAKKTREFLSIMLRQEVPFCDARRISLTDPEGAEFYQWLLDVVEAHPVDPPDCSLSSSIVNHYITRDLINRFEPVHEIIKGSGQMV